MERALTPKATRKTDGAYAYLDLLAREASAVEFEGPILQARAAGADSATLEELERAKVAALQVRAVLRRRAKREAELSALFDTASDLAGLRDLDAVLEAIVHRARQLLATDIAYMTLNDPERGDTYMRVTDGSISASFRRLRLPMGAGLGGLVAQSGTPYNTADYFADPRFRHTNTIDVAVHEEGLVAILGVPLRLGTQVIGVLFAANRSARPFAQEEVALLCSLAAHAAVAIDTARLLQETRAALTELSEANTLIRAHSESIERAADAHDRMTGLVLRGGLRGGGVEDVAAVVTEVLGGRLTVLDDEGRPLVGESGDLDTGVFDAAQSSRALGRTVKRGTRTSRPWTSVRRRCARWSCGPTTRCPTPISGFWSVPRSSRRCCCCFAGAWPRRRGGCAASCSTTWSPAPSCAGWTTGRGGSASISTRRTCWSWRGTTGSGSAPPSGRRRRRRWRTAWPPPGATRSCCCCPATGPARWPGASPPS
ncbi:hypothetical protein GCM10027612_81740 [Microbispora bryophytorum subsp. camponoti]